jgi:hypothetical protein
LFDYANLRLRQGRLFAPAHPASTALHFCSHGAWITASPWCARNARLLRLACYDSSASGFQDVLLIAALFLFACSRRRCIFFFRHLAGVGWQKTSLRRERNGPAQIIFGNATIENANREKSGAGLLELENLLRGNFLDPQRY